MEKRPPQRQLLRLHAVIYLDNASREDFDTPRLRLPGCTYADSTMRAAMPAGKEQHWTAGQLLAMRLSAVGTCRTDSVPGGEELEMRSPYLGVSLDSAEKWKGRDVLHRLHRKRGDGRYNPVPF